MKKTLKFLLSVTAFAMVAGAGVGLATGLNDNQVVKQADADTVPTYRLYVDENGLGLGGNLKLWYDNSAHKSSGTINRSQTKVYAGNGRTEYTATIQYFDFSATKTVYIQNRGDDMSYAWNEFGSVNVSHNHHMAQLQNTWNSKKDFNMYHISLTYQNGTTKEEYWIDWGGNSYTAPTNTTGCSWYYENSGYYDKYTSPTAIGSNIHLYEHTTVANGTYLRGNWTKDGKSGWLPEGQYTMTANPDNTQEQMVGGVMMPASGETQVITYTSGAGTYHAPSAKPTVDSEDSAKFEFEKNGNNAKMTKGNGGTFVVYVNTTTWKYHFKALGIKYDANGGTGSIVKTYAASDGNATVQSITGMHRGGYTFAGWKDGSGTAVAVGSVQSFIGKTSNLTLYAQWTANEYAITFNPGEDGTGGSVSPNKYSTSSSAQTVTINAPTREGYTPSYNISKYDGSGLPTVSGNIITIPANTYGKFTVNTTWTINEYTINYDKGTYGTGENGSATKEYNVPLTLPGVMFTRDGYTQEGWSTIAAGTTKDYVLEGSYTANEGTTLYPYWEEAAPGEFTVSFSLNGKTGSVPPTQTITEGDCVEKPANPADDGIYTFVNWYTTDACTDDPYNFETPVHSSFTLYAKWQIKDGLYVKRISDTSGELIPLTQKVGTENEYYTLGVILGENETIKACVYKDGVLDTTRFDKGWINPTDDVYSSIPSGFRAYKSADNNVGVNTAFTYDLYIEITNNYGLSRYSFHPCGNVYVSINDGTKVSMTRDDEHKPETCQGGQWVLDDAECPTGGKVAFYFIGNDESEILLHTIPDSAANNNISVDDQGVLHFGYATTTDLYFKAASETASLAYCEFIKGTIHGGENLYISDDGNWRDGFSAHADIAIYFFDNASTVEGHATEAWAYKSGRTIQSNNSGYLEVTVPGDSTDLWQQFIVVRYNPLKTPGVDGWDEDAAWNQGQNMTFLSNCKLVHTRNDFTTYIDDAYSDQDRATDYAKYFDTKCEFCGNTGDHLSDIKNVWEKGDASPISLKDEFIGMGTGAQTIFRNYVSSNPEDAKGTLNHAVALYDYIVGKYGVQISANPDFANRNVSMSSAMKPFTGIFTDFTDGSSNNPTLIIVISSIVTGLAIGGYFLLRKRKED